MGGVIIGFVIGIWRVFNMRDKSVRKESEMEHEIENNHKAIERLQDDVQKDNERMESAIVEIRSHSSDLTDKIFLKLDEQSEKSAHIEGKLDILISMHSKLS